MGSYNITIYDLMNQTVAHVGPTEYTQMNESEQILITNEFRTELASDEYYTVEVVVESIGVVRMKTKNISMQCSILMRKKSCYLYYYRYIYQWSSQHDH